MKIIQKQITLQPKPKGFHIITNEIEKNIDDLKGIKSGILYLFIKHTSAALTINENADPTVRTDFTSFFSKLVPEDMSQYQHTEEGPDDMTSHIKSSLLGSNITVPITNGRLNLGTWQGIYLCEFRNTKHQRTLVATILGEEL
jgi:secondary thiamine-phosphate synthase enzyme